MPIAADIGILLDFFAKSGALLFDFFVFQLPDYY